MSVVSRRSKASTVASILKTTSLQEHITTARSTMKVTFQMPYSNKVHTILQNFSNGTNRSEYEDLVVIIRDGKYVDDDLVKILEEAHNCVSLLDNKLRLFVEALLRTKWTEKGEKVVTRYQSFLLSLLSAHNYHCKFAIDRLVENFLPGADETEWEHGEPSETERKKYLHVHWLFNAILEIIPMCRDILLQSLTTHYPYLKKSTHVHQTFLHNLLWILKYQPAFRADLFRLIFSHLVTLDVNAPKEDICELENGNNDEEIFECDVDEDQMKHPIAHTLDVCINQMFNYIIKECHNLENGEVNWESTKGLYFDLLNVFDQIILPTYNTHHVQFVIFLICTIKGTLIEGFLNYLWRKATIPTMSVVIRQATIAYMAGLLARCNLISTECLKGSIQQMAEWIHSYISSQDGNEFVNTDIRLHGVFYSACQALFYIISFRQKNLVESRKNISFLESLNLTKIVTSKLNPLKVCHPAVVQNFATITRTYQLAYCYSIIEHNQRTALPTIYLDEKGSMVTTSSILENFYPFDPYVLKKSGQKIWPFYLEYQSNESPNDQAASSHTSECGEMEVDDFLEPDQTPPARKYEFSYGTSPGFKLRK